MRARQTVIVLQYAVQIASNVQSEYGDANMLLKLLLQGHAAHALAYHCIVPYNLTCNSTYLRTEASQHDCCELLKRLWRATNVARRLHGLAHNHIHLFLPRTAQERTSLIIGGYKV
jgi:hypothetical protein